MKSMHVRALTLALVALAALVSLLRAQTEKGRVPVGRFTAVRLAKPPVLDGRIEPGEWDDAFGSSGIIAAFDHVLITSATHMRMGWDEGHLYFLFVCKRGPGEWRLTKTVRFNDDYDFGDPSVEIWISPPKPVPETYQNIINTYPAVMDNHQIPSRGYTGAGWKGNWKIGVHEDPDSYIIEAAIPVADFGMAGIRDGDVWNILLCRTCQGAKPRSQGSWSITQAFAEIPQHPPVVFRDDETAVQMDGVETLLSGSYRMSLKLAAPRSRAADLSLELRWHRSNEPGDPSDIVETKKIALKPGARELVQLAGDVPKFDDKNDQRRGVLTLTVSDASGAAIFRQSFPYVVSGWTWSRPEKPANSPESKPLATWVQYAPETHALVVRADVFDMPEKTRAAAAVARVLDGSQGNRELLSTRMPRFREWYSSAFIMLEGIEAPVWDHTREDAIAAQAKAIREANKEISAREKEAREAYERARRQWEERKAKDPEKAGPEPTPPQTVEPKPLPELPKGPDPRVLVVETAALDSDGNVLATDRQEVKLLRHKFSWQNNDAGITDKVIPPWTPIRAKGKTFEVWNRTLDIDGLACAGSVANGRTAQIRSMRLVAVVDGRPIPVSATAPKIEKAAEAWVEFSGAGEAGDISFSARNRLEFDGYVVSDLTISPKSKEGAKIDELFWELVLPEDEATHFCATAGGWAAVHDETPPHWTSQQTSSGMLIGDFVPYIWLSNSERAFMWFADNDKGWITEEERKIPTQEIIREKGLVTLKVRFIETPSTLTQPTTLRYGWMTFPSRPLMPGFRAIICGQGRTDYPSARFTHFWADADWAVLWPYYCSPFPWSMERSARVLRNPNVSPEHRPMVGSIAHSIGRYMDYEGRDFSAFAVDWGEMPGIIGNADVTQSKGPIDFRVWHYRRWVREAGFKGLYIDENYLSFDRNPLTGGAYVKPDGRIQPGYTYTGLREYFKRMMIMFHQEGVARPNLWQHISSGAAYHAWYGDILMEGENVEPTNDEFDYIEVLPAGRMRAIGSPVCNGATTIMMCQSQRHATKWEPKHTHQFVGWVMAHDILPEQVRWYGPIAQAGRLHEDNVRFVGYWKPENPVKCITPDCVASMHRADDRALIWVVNKARQSRQAELRIDWKSLGLNRAGTCAVNAETGEDIPLTESGLTLPVEQRDFSAVLLVERRALDEGQSFAASFDKGSLVADQALGCEVLVGASALAESDRGKALAVADSAAQLWSHINLRDRAGRLDFRAKLAPEKRGTILSTATEAMRAPGVNPPAPSLVVERRAGAKDAPDTVALRLAGSDKQGEPAPEVSAAMELSAGWHEFSLSWKDGTAALAVDGKPVGRIPVSSLNIPQGTGPAILQMARFVFGGKGSAVEAVDDIRAWRKAP